MKMRELEFDRALFQKMERAFDESPYKAQVGEYWANYVASIVSVINKSGLSGFGDDYYLTQGFGDALKYHAPRHRLRKLVRVPAIYQALEKQIVIYNQRKMAGSLFRRHEQVFVNTRALALFMAKSLDGDVKALGINRSFNIEGYRAPWRYWMFLIYLEMFYELAQAHELVPSDVLAGNYLDIGGGYGSSLDGMALFKQFHRLGQGSVNYDVDQFPVTFIANQYLMFRNSQGTLAPLVEATDLPGTQQLIKANSHSFFRVIQNNVADDIEGLNISLFFNSNSFQEMDVDQVEAYCRFMQRNKAERAFLGAYYYDSAKESNAPARSLEVLRRHFRQVGQLSIEDFFRSRLTDPPAGRVVKGNYHLFELG